MADLRFEYETLQTLINAFDSARSDSETLATATSASPDSDYDPIVEHHDNVVKTQDSNMLSDSVGSYTNARDGVQDAYDIFKAADEAGAGDSSGE